jgi:hypothetical protein
MLYQHSQSMLPSVLYSSRIIIIPISNCINCHQWWIDRYEKQRQARRRSQGAMNGDTKDGENNNSGNMTPYTPTTPNQQPPVPSGVMAGYLLKGQLQLLCLTATSLLIVMAPDPTNAYDILHPVAYSFVVRNVSCYLLMAWTLWLKGVLTTRYQCIK